MSATTIWILFLIQLLMVLILLPPLFYYLNDRLTNGNEAISNIFSTKIKIAIALKHLVYFFVLSDSLTLIYIKHGIELFFNDLSQTEVYLIFAYLIPAVITIIIYLVRIILFDKEKYKNNPVNITGYGTITNS